MKFLTTLAASLLVSMTCSSVSMASTVTVVVSGLGGNSEFDESFSQYATDIAEQARQTAASPQDVILVRGDAAKRHVILSLLENLPVKNTAEIFQLYLIGHGNVDNREFKFNVPGPDLTGTELVEALSKIKSPKQLIVLATSASGAMLEPLAAPNRVVITATKNSRELNAVRFPEYLAKALVDTAADLNKDERISALEMFNYAQGATDDFYKRENLLAPEHARLQGDSADDIEVARYGVLLQRKADIPPALLSRRQSLSNEISALKTRKDEVDEDTYFDKLQELMLELADVQRTIDGGGNSNVNQ